VQQYIRVGGLLRLLAGCKCEFGERIARCTVMIWIIIIIITIIIVVIIVIILILSVI